MSGLCLEQLQATAMSLPRPDEKPMITETMTVNAIMRTWPEARVVFRAFQIDCEADGSGFLDELCWWRGLDVAVVIDALRHVQRVGVAGLEKWEMAHV